MLSYAREAGEGRNMVSSSSWVGDKALLCKVVIPQKQKDSLDTVGP